MSRKKATKRLEYSTLLLKCEQFFKTPDIIHLTTSYIVTKENCPSYTKRLRITHFQTLNSFWSQQTHTEMCALFLCSSPWMKCFIGVFYSFLNVLFSWTWTSIDVDVCLDDTSLWIYNWSNWMPCCLILVGGFFLIDFVPSNKMFLIIL